MLREEFSAFLIGILVGIVIFLLITLGYIIPNVREHEANRWIKAAISEGHGAYNSITGKFEWIDFASAPEPTPIVGE